MTINQRKKDNRYRLIAKYFTVLLRLKLSDSCVNSISYDRKFYQRNEIYKNSHIYIYIHKFSNDRWTWRKKVDFFCGNIDIKGRKI